MDQDTIKTNHMTPRVDDWQQIAKTDGNHVFEKKSPQT